ncbi:hypothetical protein Enr17x_02400 [Gimesia fumaroli]|uniref:Uncharacterized protein n=1 Tax=Gimesia fumaroli TaxID=2527976 RepID=A0A518I537_9PLAN|nr:hypothetical protein Enr17x_02400 [Gimesia fumaroli]
MIRRGSYLTLFKISLPDVTPQFKSFSEGDFLRPVFRVLLDKILLNKGKSMMIRLRMTYFS